MNEFNINKIGEILGKANLSPGQVGSLVVCSKWNKIIENIMPKYKDETKAVKFQNKILTVNVCTSVEMYEIHMKELQILEEFKEILGEGVVEKIKLKLGGV